MSTYISKHHNAARIVAAVLFSIICCDISAQHAGQTDGKTLVGRASQTFLSVKKNMNTRDKSLLQEAVPRVKDQKEYSYLWGYSAMVSSVSALYEATHGKEWLKVMTGMMLKGLDRYYDDKRTPAGYASYVNDAPESDRFYDDNIWLGIDMADMYSATGDKQFKNRAEEIWTFVMSGYDNVLGGGIYWCEQKKTSKNTCSNAPASVFALKMYMAMKDKKYLDRGVELYKWTKDSLEDKTDHIYFDNLSLKGKLGKDKYSYNTGQMLQAAALLYKITGEKNYLDDARVMAEASYNRFFEDTGRKDGLRILRGGEMWFDSVMLRGYIELFGIDKDDKYLKAFVASMDTAWGKDGSRDSRGLFGRYYDKRGKTGLRTLLNQAAMIEMMARLGAVR
ncbi:MAG: glycoside hydrolase family 76 protein [Prevotella sp.]